MARTHNPATGAGVWKKDSVKDVAESVGISGLPDDVATALAGDVEYRLWEIIEESMKYMRHSHRTKLKVQDVDLALKAKNIEPLWGFSSTSHLTFRKTVTSTGTVFHVDDEELDLTKVLKADLPAVPRDVSFTAHWLAIEGVQPLVKENPTPAEIAKLVPRVTTNATSSNGLTGHSSATGHTSNVTPLVKHVLSRELQLYFTRLTEALSLTGPPGVEMRKAALASVQTDPGLHQLVPYLIAWGGEQIANNLEDLDVLQRALDLFESMLQNPTLFIEPYLHQFTPPVLTCLLTSALPPATLDPTASSRNIRTTAASLLNLVLKRYSLTYPSLLSRITKTLIRGLSSPARGLGARWGAVTGLLGVLGLGESGGGAGRVVLEWLGGGLKALGEMIEREEEGHEGERHALVGDIFKLLKKASTPHATIIDETDVHNRPRIPQNTAIEQYGTVFGQLIFDQWSQGGAWVWEGLEEFEDIDEEDEEEPVESIKAEEDPGVNGQEDVEMANST